MDPEDASHHERRMRMRRMGRDGLRGYVSSIVRQQQRPLHDIVLCHALPFLPVRSLHRLRAVHPDWNLHLSSPFFAHTQTLYNLSLSGLFCCNPHADPPSFYLPFHPYSAHALPDPELSFLDGDSHVVCSSGGLLCCSNGRRQVRYTICNPATMVSTQVPLDSFPSAKHDGVALEYHPSLLNFAGEFNLVCTSYDSDSRIRKFEIFSSREREWRVLTSLSRHKLLSPHGVVVGGKACWRTVDGNILCCDIATEALEIVGAPEEARGGWVEWQIGAAGQELWCLTYAADNGEVGVHRLVGGRSWVKVRAVDVVVGGDVRPLAVDGGAGEVVVWVEGAVVGFTVATGEGRVLLDNASAATGYGEFLPYVSNLAPVGSLEDQ